MTLLPRMATVVSTLALVLALAAPSLASASHASLAMQDDEDTAEKAKKLLEDGIAQLTAKKYDESIATYKKAIALAEKHELDEEATAQILQLAHYNIACAHSLAKQLKPALDHFEKALEAGFEDFEHIKTDTDLDNVRGEARFKEILAKRHDRERGKLRAELAHRIHPPLFDLEIDAPTIAGGRVKLADLRGKTVVVVYFGTWTERSLSEIPHLVKLKKELGPRGVELIGIAYEVGKTDEATAKKLRDLAAEKGMDWPIILVGKDDPLLKKMPDGDQFPSKLLVDVQGKVRAAEVGYQTYEVIEALVLALVEEKAAAAPAKPAEKKPEEKKPGEDEPI